LRNAPSGRASILIDCAAPLPNLGINTVREFRSGSVDAFQRHGGIVNDTLVTVAGVCAPVGLLVLAAGALVHQRYARTGNGILLGGVTLVLATVVLSIIAFS
jgi:hypothetical protein